MNELVFEVTQEDGRRLLSLNVFPKIFSRKAIPWDAVPLVFWKRCAPFFYFGYQTQTPSIIRLHLVRDELLAKRMKVPRDLSSLVSKGLPQLGLSTGVHQEGSHVHFADRHTNVPTPLRSKSQSTPRRHIERHRSRCQRS